MSVEEGALTRTGCLLGGDMVTLDRKYASGRIEWSRLLMKEQMTKKFKASLLKFVFLPLS